MTEIERQKKVIAMMITAHSVLRDRYTRLSLLFENSLLVASVILNAIIFIDSGYITKMTGVSEDSQRLIGGISSILVFGISIVLLQVRWKEKAESHSKAAQELFNLLHECRTIMNLDEGEEKNTLIAQFVSKYALVTGEITQIPESKFNSLKLKHYRKIELSRLIDKNPGSILIVLKMKLFISSLKKKTE